LARAIDFFIYSRARPDAPDADSLTEEHWAYMDRFADRMVARGPTLGPDRETWTGSLHILDLPSGEAAVRFVEDEPYHRAGLFAEHLIRRFANRLGRTMWEFPGAADEPRFLVIAHAPLDIAGLPRERLIVHGDLLDGTEVVGTALALQAPSRGAIAGALDAEVHDWEFGGRR
jgi:uncharacterized protein YciI